MVNTTDEHAPMKKRKSISQPAPFMNKTATMEQNM
jgi:hypothetical protein